WYEIDGRTYAGRYAAKWATIKQALRHRGSSGAFILLSGPIINEENQEGAESVTAFAKGLLPFIRQRLS
ncbi:MAG: EpsI family protein, partial [Nitrospirota bacterium]|nr:EpsI family protein [Nitrospirota bacterium]